MSDADTMPLEDYLAQGGKLTSPENAPPRYRGELMRLMATFVDSELAGAAGFADTINIAPGIKERIAASRIVLEKLDHGERVLDIMGSFGADTSRYANHHPWTARLARDADLGAARHGSDMRLVGIPLSAPGLDRRRRDECADGACLGDPARRIFEDLLPAAGRSLPGNPAARAAAHGAWRRRPAQDPDRRRWPAGGPRLDVVLAASRRGELWCGRFGAVRAAAGFWAAAYAE